jgi:hypothetical protein
MNGRIISSFWEHTGIQTYALQQNFFHSSAVNYCHLSGRGLEYVTP